jgi:hypothetical protein
VWRAEDGEKLDHESQDDENQADAPDAGFGAHALAVEAHLVDEAGIVGEDG